MDKVSFLYKTDFGHSFASRCLIGVFTDPDLLSDECEKLIQKDQEKSEHENDYELDKQVEWHRGFLDEQNQTQGLNEFELVIEEVPINRLLQ